MIARQKIALLLLVSTLLSNVLLSFPTRACGPFFDDPDFSYTLHPDIPLSKYAAGNLAVLKQTTARSYLVVAWRYLSGIPLSQAEQKAVISLWEQRLDNGQADSDKAIKTWTDARKHFGIKAESNYFAERSFSGK